MRAKIICVLAICFGVFLSFWYCGLTVSYNYYSNGVPIAVDDAVSITKAVTSPGFKMTTMLLLPDGWRVELEGSWFPDFLSVAFGALFLAAAVYAQRGRVATFEQIRRLSTEQLIPYGLLALALLATTAGIVAYSDYKSYLSILADSKYSSSNVSFLEASDVVLGLRTVSGTLVLMAIVSCIPTLAFLNTKTTNSLRTSFAWAFGTLLILAFGFASQPISS